MAKKTSFKLSFDSVTPVITFLVFISLFVHLMQNFINTENFFSVFSAPSKMGTKNAFEPKEILHYIRFLLHIFGSKDFVPLSVNCLFLIFLAPDVEHRFGSGFTLVMCLVCSLVTGIVNASFMSDICFGLDCVIWMFFLLITFPAENRKEVNVFMLFAFLLFVTKEINLIIYKKQFSLISQITGGFVGSLLSIAASSPKKKPTKKTTSVNKLKAN
ncbi:MAG: rhomboid family intramembrane serine protease [Treponema sp.]|jgi:membrane associated rhomboid family serine protease|nr:rhomboid family intramembrane serine protease [Treponema sp.]